MKRSAAVRNAGPGRAALIVVAALLPAACWPVFREPAVRLDAVRLETLSLRGGTLIARVLVMNPNRFQLRTLGLSYQLDLGAPGGSDSHWVRLAQGRMDGEVNVAARDSTAVEIPLEFTYSGVGAAIRSFMDRGVLDYRLAGDLMVTRPVSRRVPFRRLGTVSVTTSD